MTRLMDHRLKPRSYGYTNQAAVLCVALLIFGAAGASFTLDSPADIAHPVRLAVIWFLPAIAAALWYVTGRRTALWFDDTHLHVRNRLRSYAIAMDDVEELMIKPSQRFPWLSTTSTANLLIRSKATTSPIPVIASEGMSTRSAYFRHSIEAIEQWMGTDQKTATLVMSSVPRR